MADTHTTNYNWVMPEVGASADTWGDKLNADLQDIDTQVKTTDDLANGALPKTGGTLSGNLTIAIAGGVPVLSMQTVGVAEQMYLVRSIDGTTGVIHQSSPPGEPAALSLDVISGSPSDGAYVNFFTVGNPANDLRFVQLINSAGAAALYLRIKNAGNGVDFVGSLMNFYGRPGFEGTYTVPLVLRDTRFWIDDSGYPRYRTGSDPGSNVDGARFDRTWDFESGLVAMSSWPMHVVIAHGLGAVPKQFEFNLVCRSAIWGYVPGDRVTHINSDTQAGPGHNATMYADATNIGWHALQMNIWDKAGTYNLNAPSTAASSWWIQGFARL